VFFFFQAEDGIRDRTVTGVQTCALPIYINSFVEVNGDSHAQQSGITLRSPGAAGLAVATGCDSENAANIGNASALAAREFSGSRSEERRVGKECRSRRAAACWKKKSRGG